MKNKLVILTDFRSGSELLFWSLSMSINECEFSSDYIHGFLNIGSDPNNKFFMNFCKKNQISVSNENVEKYAIELQSEYFKLYDISKVYKTYNLRRDNEYWDWLINQDFKILHLIRKNSLRRFVSIKVAMKNSLWYTTNHVESPTSVTLDIGEMKYFLSLAEDSTSFFKSKIKADVIYYEDLVVNTKDRIKEIISLIGEQPNRIITPITKPTNPFSLRDIITNYDDVSNELSKDGLEWMLEDIPN